MNILVSVMIRFFLPKNNWSMSNRDKKLMEHYEPEMASGSESAWQRVLDKYGVSSFFKDKKESAKSSSE
jgi:hypothetical protein